MFRIGGNTFYDRKNKILMKIPEFKRSGIGLIAEFCRISNGFPKQAIIDSILLPMRNIVNLQLKPSVTKALQHNTVQAQEPVSTRKATKRVIEILDAKYDKANLPEIVKDNCSHLEPSQ